MDADQFATQRRALHGVAELLVAGPAYADHGDIRLRPTPGGFGAWRQPGARVDGIDLVVGDLRVALRGTIAFLADAAGIVHRALDDVYHDGSGVAFDEPIDITADTADLVAQAFSWGDQALEEFAPGVERVLWPEHFDIGISVDEVNYGVSPGDEYETWPYAYVGPWRVPTDPFFEAPFGAARRLSGFADAAAVAAFFAEGRVLALRG